MRDVISWLKQLVRRKEFHKGYMDFNSTLWLLHLLKMLNINVSSFEEDHDLKVKAFKIEGYCMRMKHGKT